jgi:ligand-binding sensor domain-containing protein/signal transduction histidine kinase
LEAQPVLFMPKLKFYKSVIFFLVSFLFIGQLIAQNNIKFNRLTVEDGLSQNTIKHIIQDKNGLIWFATNGGLNRFDGIEFKTFVYDRNADNSISDNIINHLFEDARGNIWISTQNGLSVYNQINEAFTTYKNVINNPHSISHNHVTCVTEDMNGIFWIGTDGGGLNRFDPSTNHFKALRYISDNPQSISSNSINCLETDKYGYVWVGTKSNGLNMLDPVSERFFRYMHSESDKINSISNDQINTIYEDYEGDLWIGTASGIDLMNPNINGRHLSSRDEILNMSKLLSTQGSAASKNITSIYQGASGMIWFGTTDNGLGFIKKYLNVTGNYLVDPNNDYSLLSNEVTSVFDDRDGILWIGTNSGINSIDKRNRFVWHKRTPGQQNTFSSNNIRSIYQEENGVFWLGSHDQGLTKYDPLTEIYTNFSTDDFIVEGESIRERNKLLRKFDKRQSSGKLQKLNYLSHNRINDIHRISKNYLWVGTGGGGINVLNTHSNSISTLRHDPSNDNSLSSDNIRCIFQDSQGRRWIGTEGGGLNLFNGQSFKRYTTDENDIFTISSNNVRAISEDKNGFIWIGTFGGGLNKFDPENDRFIRYYYQENDHDGLSSNNIYTLYFDDESEKLWIGSSVGLNILNVVDNHFQHLTISDGLPSNTVYSILDDTAGNLWISTNKGISRINKYSLAIKNYDREDGLESTEFNPNTAFKTSNGEMFFGSNNGYCSFFPNQIIDNFSKPEILFTDFKILNEKVGIDQPGSPLKKSIANTDTIILSHNDISISFEFVALNFTDSKKNQYAYKMENFEENWNYVGTRRFANYTNLRPGIYTFKVKASNNDGIWNEEGKSILIIVKPPFWETWWFYSILVLFIIGMIIISIQLRTRALHKSKIRLEELIKKRTKQIKNQNKRLEKANKEIVDQKNEIETQNKLLKQKNTEISKATQELDNINKELVNINSNLEEKVEERTYSLRKMNEDLINANNELDKFIYRASHDLKGPIARLLGVSILAKMDNKDETLKEYIELIEKGAVDINKVLNKLNNIHFINKENIQTEEIDFQKIINQCRPNLAAFIDPADLKISIDSKSKFHLRSDAKLMSIILDNLLENAVIFRKTKKAEIDIILYEDPKSLIIKVTDNGLGILKEQHDKIFDMFYRGSQKSKGNGLGLYLVKKSVAKLQGQIEVASEEGKFTTFTIAFPKVIVSKELQTLLS